MKKILRYIILIICTFFLTLIVFFVLPTQVDKSFNRVSNSLIPHLNSETKDFHQTLFIADLHADSLLWNRNLFL